MNRENHKDKDLKNTYLWVDREGHYGEKYEELLLYKQSIPELIRFYETEDNGDKALIYVLDFRNSFLEHLSGGRMECGHMESFIKSLVKVMHVIDEYLLDPSNLVLEMDYIFGKNEKWSYIYIPGYGEDFWRQMEKLSEEWLNYVDYENEKAVLWAYTFYQKVHNEDCSVEDLTNILKLEKTLPVNPKEEMVMVAEDKLDRQGTDTEEKKKFRNWLKRKWRHLFRTKKHKPYKDYLDFYEERGSLEDTCPILELPETYESDKRKLFTLIPLGETEMPVICIEQFPTLIGRAPEEADICLQDMKISRLHARIEGSHQEVKIVDMSSANGTYRNGECLKPGNEYILHVGDILKLADLEFICQWC